MDRVKAPSWITAGISAGADGNTLSVNWTAGAGTAYQYEVQVTPVSFSGPDAGRGGSAITYFTSGSQAAIALPNSFLSLSPTDYFVALRAVSAAGVYSPWGAMLDAGRTAPDPAVTPPTGTPTNIQATGGGGSANLTFDLPQGENDVTAVELTATGPGLASPKVTGFTYPPTGSGQGIGVSLPLPNSTYSITVKVYNAGGYGGSGTVSFTTGNFTPPTSQPTDLQATRVTATEADVSWSGTPWPDVSLHAYSDPFGINEVYGTISGSGNSATITNLPANTPLWLQLGSAGSSAAELPAPLALTTLAEASPVPTVLDPDAKEIAPDGLPQAGDLLFARTGDLNQPADVPITLTGTTPGSGYKLVDAYTGQIVTGSVNFPIGFSNKVIEVIPINDGSAQWTRTVIATEGTSATVQTDATPATVGIEGGNFAVTLGDGSDNQTLQASADGTQNLVPLALTLPTTIVPGVTVTLTVHSPVGIDVWGTGTPQPGDAPLNGTGTTVTWTESADPAVHVPAIVFVGVTGGSTLVNCTWFSVTCKDNPPSIIPVTPVPIITTTTTGTPVSLQIHQSLDPNTNSLLDKDITGMANSRLIGQQEWLRGVIIGPRSAFAGASWLWTIPGSTLERMYEAGDSWWDAGYRKAIPLRTTSASWQDFFWVTTAGVGTNSPDTDLVKLTLGGLTAATTFMVYSPSSAVSVVQGTPRIGYSTSRKGWRVGMLGNATVPVGISWSATVDTPSGQGFGRGLFRFVQKIYPWRSTTLLSGFNKLRQTPERAWGLDTSDPYPSHPGDPFDGTQGWITDAPAPHETNDSPSNPLDASEFADSTANDAFKTYLMYQPPGLNSEWVPLQSEYWAYGISVIQSPPKSGAWAIVGKPFQYMPPFTRESREPEWSIIWTGAKILPLD